MATYDYDDIGFYNTGGLGTQDSTAGAGGTLDDGQAAGLGSNAFSSTETFTVGADTLQYSGTVTIDGIDYPAFTVIAGPNTGLNALAVEGVALPNILPAGQITAGAFVTCFAAGTEIATADGFALVEDLKAGDMVRTHDGRDVAVKWVGRQTVATRFMPAERSRPVLFAAGSLGGGLPTSDLTVTADHGMLLGDTMCHAGALVNGTTITRLPLEQMGERYTVYHVETDAHEVILANGAASETFIDNVSRRVFDNFAEFEALYGDVAEMEALEYPRAMSARQVPGAIKASLAGVKVA